MVMEEATSLNNDVNTSETGVGAGDNHQESASCASATETTNNENDNATSVDVESMETEDSDSMFVAIEPTTESVASLVASATGDPEDSSSDTQRKRPRQHEGMLEENESFMSNSDDGTTEFQNLSINELRNLA